MSSTPDKRICSFTLVIIADESGKGIKCQQELSIFGWVLTSSLLVGFIASRSWTFSFQSQRTRKWEVLISYWLQYPKVGIGLIDSTAAKHCALHSASGGKICLGVYCLSCLMACSHPGNLFSLLFCQQKEKALQYMGMVHPNDSNGLQWLGQTPDT